MGNRMGIVLVILLVFAAYKYGRLLQREKHHIECWHPYYYKNMHLYLLLCICIALNIFWSFRRDLSTKNPIKLWELARASARARLHPSFHDSKLRWRLGYLARRSFVRLLEEV